MIAEYVEKDPTKFGTYEQFQSGVTAMKGFFGLRTESVKGQLDGSIPSTADGQTADSSALIDASSVNLSDMGTMGSGGGGFGRGGKERRSSQSDDSNTDNSDAKASPSPTPSENSGSTSGNFNGQFPGNFDGQFPGNFDGQTPDNPGGQTPANVSGSDVTDFPFNQAGQSEGNEALLLLVSVAVLIGGLIFAIKFGERRP